METETHKVLSIGCVRPGDCFCVHEGCFSCALLALGKAGINKGGTDSSHLEMNKRQKNPSTPTSGAHYQENLLVGNR